MSCDRFFTCSAAALAGSALLPGADGQVFTPLNLWGMALRGHTGALRHAASPATLVGTLAQEGPTCHEEGHSRGCLYLGCHLP